MIFFWHIFFQTLKKHIKRLKHHKFETCLSYKAKRLASRFQLKDHVKKKHVDNMVYKIECPDCESFYIGESGRRLEEQFNTVAHMCHVCVEDFRYNVNIFLVLLFYIRTISKTFVNKSTAIALIKSLSFRTYNFISLSM